MSPRPASGRQHASGFLSKVSSQVPLSYLLVRATTSAGAVAGGLIQTFVFARVLGTQDFAVFILLSSFGVAMNALDFGISKLLFVRLREAFLKGKLTRSLARQATSVVAIYVGVVAICAAICGMLVVALPSLSAWQATQYELYFLFAALNLVWLPLRNISLAVDQFVFFEYLEAARRIGNAALTLALLIGLPMAWFLIAINLLWAILLFLSVSRLVTARAMTFGSWHLSRNWAEFYRKNRAALAGSSIYGTTEIYIYAFPYAVVSAFFGLGSATIILDTVLKVQRGAALLYAAGCDVAVPSQTRAFAASDRAALLRGFWLAVAICAVPAAALCLALLLYSDVIFTTLLGSAAVMPDAAVNILILMLIAGAIQAVSHSLLLHTGFFKEAARLGLGVALALTVVIAIAVALGADLIAFMSIYAGIIAAGAFFAMVYASVKLFRPQTQKRYRKAAPGVPARPAALRKSRPASKASR
jgi:O-antigen/teichoic acid export membrane protein